MKKNYRIGLDIGSTTAKIVIADSNGDAVFSDYRRHHADVTGVVKEFLGEVLRVTGDGEAEICVTGSVGMGLAERLGLPFVQEVIAATRFTKELYPGITTIIDIGGEDAKIVFLREDGNVDLRMNGNCAGGTGAFIDQMAMLLGVEVDELDALAQDAERKYPIASRCGVFSKTDIQNLISKNARREDIAASVFHAVAVQTVVTLSRGYSVKARILLCGGPLTFIPSLREAFCDYLELVPSDFVVPRDGNLVPAWGAALSAEGKGSVNVQELLERLGRPAAQDSTMQGNGLAPIFSSENEYEKWRLRKDNMRLVSAPLRDHQGKAYIGIDSGSTTTKIAVIDEQERLLYSYYAPNGGNPVGSVRKGLEELERQCAEVDVDLSLNGSCSTGYGEDLVKAAFDLDNGVVETIVHYLAARKIDPQVSFILDIGGQDMKAIFVEDGVVNRMEINEACSSGCGSFIETFARSLEYSVEQFAREACLAQNPCDLGTRCTVFMNSKVKQVLREGASVGDIAAGLTYSVVKNCLYKVLKLKRVEELGEHIVVQGGTMRNDSVVRALEQLAGAEVGRSDMPELMGAYGCALYAKSADAGRTVSLDQLLGTAEYRSRMIQCGGCENQCQVHKYAFGNGNIYYSGHKCEKVFASGGAKKDKGRNVSVEKYAILFDRPSGGGAMRIGIPRCLNMYENYPFWHALFGGCGLSVELSSNSTYSDYERGVHSVMSDNICFPAKLVHSHIYELIDKKVDRVFFPYVVFEKHDGGRNSFNCPIVSGYSEVIKSVITTGIPIDSPVITFKDRKVLEKQCVEYLRSLGIPASTARKAFKEAIAAQDGFDDEICQRNVSAYEESRAAGRMTILLAGRPYHADPLVQHKLSDMLSDMGVTVVTEDIVRGEEGTTLANAHHVSQWAYVNRILRAAQWVADRGDDIHFVQMTSFGCGPDAFLLDEVRSVLRQGGKALTLLKIDDINNVGSVKLRVRSLVESLRFNHGGEKRREPFVSTRVFTKEDRRRTILIPYFTDYLSPLIPSLLELAGYNVVQLPESDTDSAEYGLRFANNEVCYPATLITGDLIKALDTGAYDLSETAVIITQTGGQCRATNYIALIKRGLVEAGYEQVPVLSLAMGSGLVNEQSGFTINWAKIIQVTLAAILFGDTLSKFYHASAVRELKEGEAACLRDHYMDEAKIAIARNDHKAIYEMISSAARDFDGAVLPGDHARPKVGVVGEIFLKFNSFAHKNVVKWLVDQKIEVIPPILTDFFTQAFVNRRVKHDTGVQKSGMPLFLFDAVYSIVLRKIGEVNRRAAAFRYFTPFHDIFETAENGKEIISLSAQFGEGWLLPAEIVTFAKQGVNNVVSLQPFGCIANHIVSKGMEKKIKDLYPQMNMLSLDFDSGVSDVNVTNRLMLMTANFK